MISNFWGQEIEPNEEEIVQYGLKILYSDFIGMIIFLIIGFIFNYTFDAFLLFCFIYPLRKYAGGFHAETKIGCYLLSCWLVLTVFYLVFIVNWNNWLYLLTVVTCSIIIFLFSPVENGNKRLDQLQITKYKKRVRIILVADSTLFWVAIIGSWTAIKKIITACLLIGGVTILAGKIKIKYTERGNI